MGKPWKHIKSGLVGVRERNVAYRYSEIKYHYLFKAEAINYRVFGNGRVAYRRNHIGGVQFELRIHFLHLICTLYFTRIQISRIA